MSAVLAPDVTTTVPDRTGLHSCLYEGTLGHKRHIDVGHGFSQPIVLAYLDLDEVADDRVFGAHPLWSTRRAAPVRFRRQDMHGDPTVPLRTAVEQTLRAELGDAAARGPIRVLTHLRHWAWTFNPISIYFAFDADDDRVEAVLVEVTNTPWHERKAYVLRTPDDVEHAGVRWPKDLHVSPFMDLALDHVLRFSAPGGERLTVEMDDRRQDGSDELVFSARMVLHRLPLDRASMTHVLRTHRLPAHRVSAGIHLNALKLWRKGAPFRRHPKHQKDPA